MACPPSAVVNLAEPRGCPPLQDDTSHEHTATLIDALGKVPGIWALVGRSSARILRCICKAARELHDVAQERLHIKITKEDAKLFDKELSGHVPGLSALAAMRDRGCTPQHLTITAAVHLSDTTLCSIISACASHAPAIALLGPAHRLTPLLASNLPHAAPMLRDLTLELTDLAATKGAEQLLLGAAQAKPHQGGTSAAPRTHKSGRHGNNGSSNKQAHSIHEATTTALSRRQYSGGLVEGAKAAASDGGGQGAGSGVAGRLEALGLLLKGRSSVPLAGLEACTRLVALRLGLQVAAGAPLGPFRTGTGGEAAPAVAAIASLAPTLRSLELYGSALGRLMQPPQRLAGLSALTALTKLVLHLPSDFQSDSTNETNIADLDLLDTGQQSRMESQQASTPGAAPSAGVVSAAAAAAVQVAVRRRLLLPHGLWTSKLNEGALGQTAAAAAGVAVWWGDEWGAEQGPVHALESEVLRRSVRWWSCGILGPPLCGLTELDLGQQGNLGVADLWAVATVAGQLTRLVVRGVDVRQGAAYNRRLDPGGGSGGGGGALGAVVGLGEAPEPRMMMAFPAPPPMAFPPRLREVKFRRLPSVPVLAALSALPHLTALHCRRAAAPSARVKSEAAAAPEAQPAEVQAVAAPAVAEAEPEAGEGAGEGAVAEAAGAPIEREARGGSADAAGASDAAAAEGSGAAAGAPSPPPPPPPARRTLLPLTLLGSHATAAVATPDPWVRLCLGAALELLLRLHHQQQEQPPAPIMPASPPPAAPAGRSVGTGVNQPRAAAAGGGAAAAAGAALAAGPAIAVSNAKSDGEELENAPFSYGSSKSVAASVVLDVRPYDHGKCVMQGPHAESARRAAGALAGGAGREAASGAPGGGDDGWLWHLGLLAPYVCAVQFSGIALQQDELELLPVLLPHLESVDLSQCPALGPEREWTLAGGPNGAVHVRWRPGA